MLVYLEYYSTDEMLMNEGGPNTVLTESCVQKGDAAVSFRNALLFGVLRKG